MNKMKRHSCDEQYDAEKEKAAVLCDKSHIHPGGGFWPRRLRRDTAGSNLAP